VRTKSQKHGRCEYVYPLTPLQLFFPYAKILLYSRSCINTSRDNIFCEHGSGVVAVGSPLYSQREREREREILNASPSLTVGSLASFWIEKRSRAMDASSPVANASSALFVCGPVGGLRKDVDVSQSLGCWPCFLVRVLLAWS